MLTLKWNTVGCDCSVRTRSNLFLFKFSLNYKVVIRKSGVFMMEEKKRYVLLWYDWYDQSHKPLSARMAPHPGIQSRSIRDDRKSWPLDYHVLLNNQPIYFLSLSHLHLHSPHFLCGKKWQMGVSSPPLGPKPRSALPSHVLHESSPLHMSTSARERDSLNSSIRTSFLSRTPIDLESSGDVQSLTNGAPSVPVSPARDSNAAR